MTKYETNDFYDIPLTDTIKRTGYNNRIDHGTFGGLINTFDIDGHHYMSTMAKKIQSDWNFDRYCGLSIMGAERKNAYQKRYKK